VNDKRPVARLVHRTQKARVQVHGLRRAEVCAKTCSASAKALSVSPRTSWEIERTCVSRRPARCLRSGKVPAGLSTSCTIAREVSASISS